MRLTHSLWLISSVAAVSLLLGCGKGTIWSTRDEVHVGREASREVERQYRLDATSDDAKRVTRIGERLLPHTDQRPGVPYSFKVLDDKTVNAVSLPGGPVYVFRGLLDLVGDDDDALACVMGHEIGHINARHISHMVTKELEANLILGVALANQGRTLQDIVGLTQDLVNLKYSRDDEYEADRRGLSYAYKAGFDPNGMIRFFGKLQALEKRGEKDPEFLRTHPVTKARVARAQKIIETHDFRYGQ